MNNIFDAIKSNNKDLLIFLIENGHNINQLESTNDGDTPLGISIDRNNQTIFDILIQNTVDINCSNNYGCTPLMAAACNQNIYYLQMLLKLKSNINDTDNEQWTALYYSMCEVYSDHKELLLKYGFNETELESNEDTLVTNCHILNVGILKEFVYPI